MCFGQVPSSCVINTAELINLRDLERIFYEAIEVAFIICNVRDVNYGISTIADIIHQIIPTAVIFNSGYWVFYKHPSDFKICICDRFALNCYHKFEFHWVNWRPIENVDDFCVNVKQNIVSAPINVVLDMCQAQCSFYVDVNISMCIQCVNPNPSAPQKISPLYTIKTRYYLQPEKYPSDFMVALKPHPSSLIMYGTIFNFLSHRHIYLTRTGAISVVPESNIIGHSYYLKKFTLAPFEEEITISERGQALGTIANSVTVDTARLCQTQRSNPYRCMADASVQTTESRMLERRRPQILVNWTESNSEHLDYYVDKNGISRAKFRLGRLGGFAGGYGQHGQQGSEDRNNHFEQTYSTIAKRNCNHETGMEKYTIYKNKH